MSAQEQTAEVLTVLNAALSPSPAFDFDEVPSPRPNDYLELSVSRRFGGESRASGQRGRIGYRITARAVALNIFNARRIHELTQAALEGLFLDVAGKQTPIEFETEEPIGPDGEGVWFSGLVSYTYTT